MKIFFKKRVTFLNINFAIFILWFCLSFLGPIRSFSIAGNIFTPSVYLSVVAFPCFLILYLIRIKNDNMQTMNRVAVLLLLLLVILSIESLGMSYFYYYDTLGLFNTNTFKVWIIQIIKYTYDLFGVFYAVYMLFHFKKSFLKYLKVVFYVFITFWVIFGIFQILIFNINNQTINSIYDRLNFLKIFVSTDTMERLRLNHAGFRFYGISSEPSSNSILMCCVLLPVFIVLFNKIMEKEIRRVIEIIYICFCFIIFIVFLFLTKSSSVFATLLMFILVFLFLSNFTSKKSKKMKLISAVLAIFGFAFVFMLLLQIPLISKAITKIANFSDYSTLHRYSTVYNDFLIFIKNPIFGCGDGNQGYFYFDNIIGTSFSKSPETQMALTGQLGLLNGGATCVAYLSGFGLFGMVVLVIILKMILCYRTRFETNSPLRKVILPSILSLVFLFFVSSGIHFNASSYIVFALPFIFGGDSKFSKKVQFFELYI